MDNYKGFLIESYWLPQYAKFYFYKKDDEIIAGFGDNLDDCKQQIDDIYEEM